MFLMLILTGCGSEDQGSDASSKKASGLWFGTTTETAAGIDNDLSTYLLFYEEDVYILREDEAQIGSYEVEENGHVAMDTQVFTFTDPDTDNNFYVGSRSTEQIIVDSLFATNTTLFANYENNTRFGSMELTLDTAQEDNLSFSRVAGTWGTTDSVLYINDEGGFIGNGTDCQWDGDLTSASGSFATLSISRQGIGCGIFTPSETSQAEGIAFIDGEGLLHFLSLYNNIFLWQRFTSQNITVPADTTDEEAAAEEEPAAEEV
ncbi:MAG: hypothetical protein ACJAYK_001519 [Crocinitomicaceae bacterium]|jgi:hypothetical protein